MLLTFLSFRKNRYKVYTVVTLLLIFVGGPFVFRFKRRHDIFMQACQDLEEATRLYHFRDEASSTQALVKCTSSFNGFVAVQEPLGIVSSLTLTAHILEEGGYIERGIDYLEQALVIARANNLPKEESEISAALQEFRSELEQKKSKENQTSKQNQKQPKAQGAKE